MPIYEYEPLDHDCLICNGRMESLQGVNDPEHSLCPTCGLPIRRVISKTSFKVGNPYSAGEAARKGFTTYKKVGAGQYEKVAGEGADAIVPRPEDVQAVNAERQEGKKLLDFDAD